MSNDKTWLRRHALYMASNLPDDIEDARAVVRVLSEIVEGFFAEPQQRDVDGSNVVKLVK
jgi:hypothetical protein